MNLPPSITLLTLILLLPINLLLDPLNNYPEWGSLWRIPMAQRGSLVLMYHPFNIYVKKILLTNFNILIKDETSKEIFPLLPLTSYWQDQNTCDILLQTSMQSQTKHTLVAPPPPLKDHNATSPYRSISPETPAMWSTAFHTLMNTIEPFLKTCPFSLLQQAKPQTRRQGGLLHETMQGY